ncbi:PREDICTED: uncharacterized protein LOC105150888 isoform X2 [Acromyrmex echinatior]|uniref:uncharacterized protein LOC105150888 isoform X2 n=1 Tax=Acromyrmex echinatior TaxID=103372 RepID=UPI000580C2DA|nr:PREDICTED: uncharacterized protein LOC105150888 isoform X2 [Acromyrmex echinatior]
MEEGCREKRREGETVPSDLNVVDLKVYLPYFDHQQHGVLIYGSLVHHKRIPGSEPMQTTLTSSSMRGGTISRRVHLPSDTSATKLTVQPHAHTNCCRIISSVLALSSGQRKLLRGYRWNAT